MTEQAGDTDRSSTPPAGGTGGRQPFPRLLSQVAGGLFLLVGALLVYLVVAVWPAVRGAAAQAVTDGQPPPRTAVTIVGPVELTLDPDAALVVLVVITSALGSYVHAATSFTTYVGNRTLVASWMWWYALRIFIGVALAVIFYTAVRGGLLAAQAHASDVNPYGIAALAGLVGMFSKQATDKLKELFDTLFRTQEGDAARRDKVTPGPRLAGVEPPRVPRGQRAELLLRGQRFHPEAAVQVTRSHQGRATAVVAERGAVTATSIAVAIAAAELEEPGQLEFTVVNPDTAGGPSNTRTVDIEDLEAAAAEPPTPVPPPRGRRLRDRVLRRPGA